MKLCVAFGNCQAGVLRKYLRDLSPFFEQYDYKTYANWELIKNNSMTIPINDLKRADLIIYQPLGDVHGCYSTNKKNPDSFMNLISADCKLISFPRLYNNAMWPLFHKNEKRDAMYGAIKNHIDSLDHLTYLYDNDLIDYDFTNRMAQNYMISKEKESETDIKIIDFIYDNMKKHKMFLTNDHPTSYVFNEVSRQICDILDIEYNFEKGTLFEENIWGLPDNVYNTIDKQYPISRYMIKHLGLEYVVDETTLTNNFYKSLTIDYGQKYLGLKP